MRVRILLVDDDEQLRAVVGRSLRRWFEVTEVASPDAALGLLGEDGDRNFDVIVSDYRMPEGNFDALEMMGVARDHCGHLGRILMSGDVEQSPRFRTLVEEGLLHAFVEKPCDSDALRGVIEKVVDRQKATRSDSRSSKPGEK